MKYIQKDFKEYIKEMDNKDYAIVDPPWAYNDMHPKLAQQLDYSLWSNNADEMDYIFQYLKAKYLFLWVTNSMIEDVFESYFRTDYLFKYRTLVTWKKLTVNNKIFYGMGSYFRNATEHIMIFTQQGAKPLRLSLRNIFEEQAGKRTLKPKLMERIIIEKMQSSRGAYIFSGLEIESFEGFDIDCVDIQEIV